MTMISWRKSLTSAVAVAAVAVVGATSLAGDAAAQEERIRWRVPGAFPTSLPALGDNLVWVADQLNAASGGAGKVAASAVAHRVPKKAREVSRIPTLAKSVAVSAQAFQVKALCFDAKRHLIPCKTVQSK